MALLATAAVGGWSHAVVFGEGVAGRKTANVADLAQHRGRRDGADAGQGLKMFPVRGSRSFSSRRLRRNVRSWEARISSHSWRISSPRRSRAGVLGSPRTGYVGSGMALALCSGTARWCSRGQGPRCLSESSSRTWASWATERPFKSCGRGNRRKNRRARAARGHRRIARSWVGTWWSATTAGAGAVVTGRTQALRIS